MPILLPLLVLLLAASPPTPGPIILSEDLQVELLGDGLWRHISYSMTEQYGRVPANGLLVVSEGEAALIDTPWTDEDTALLLDWVEEHLGAKVTVVIPTHSHGDCLGGLAEAHRRGARSYALDRTVELAKAAGSEVPQTAIDEFGEVRVGSQRLELHFAGPGHVLDNIVVWIPEEKVLFGGCLVRSAASNFLGYTAEGDLEKWPHTIERLRREYGDAELIVPGHGKPGGLELLERTLELLAAPP